MASIGDETQTESSAVAPAGRQNELQSGAEIGSVKTTTATAVTRVIGAVLIGGLAWALVWAITEKQTYRALGILIGAAVGAVVRTRHEQLIMRVTIIAVLVAIVLVVCWAIFMIGYRVEVIIKKIVTAITGETGKKADIITYLTIWMFHGIYPGLSIRTRNGFGIIPARDIVYIGGGATVLIPVITAVIAVIGVPVYQTVMVLVVDVFAALISTIIWAAIFKICAAIFALEFKISIDAVMKVAVFFMAAIGLNRAFLILILLLWEVHLSNNFQKATASLVE